MASSILTKLTRFVRDSSYRNMVLSTKLQKTRLRTGFALPPRVIVLIVTNDCNLRCRMCAMAMEDPTFVRLDMPPDLAVKILDEARRWGSYIVLCGGEPMHYPHWFDVVSHASSLGLPTNITTNGLVLTKNAEAILDCGLTDLYVSVDGVGEVHNQVRGKKNLFDKAIKAIGAVHEIRSKRGVDFPKIGVNFTISPDNFHNLLDYAEYMAEVPGVDRVSFLHLCFADEESKKIHNEIFGRLLDARTKDMYRPEIDAGGIDTHSLIEQTEEILRRDWPFEVFFRPDHPTDELEDYYHDPRYRRRTIVDCPAPWEQITISPVGEATPCLDYIAGNVQEESLKRIWNNKKMRRFRQALRKNGRFPLCQRCCF